MGNFCSLQGKFFMCWSTIPAPSLGLSVWGRSRRGSGSSKLLVAFEWPGGGGAMETPSQLPQVHSTLCPTPLPQSSGHSKVAGSSAALCCCYQEAQAGAGGREPPLALGAWPGLAPLSTPARALNVCRHHMNRLYMWRLVHENPAMTCISQNTFTVVFLCLWTLSCNHFHRPMDPHTF